MAVGIDPQKTVPARYVGSAQGILMRRYGPYHDGNGNPWQQKVKDALDPFGTMSDGINQNDTIMVWPQEVYGLTYKHDPRGNAPSILVGIGHVALPEDAGKSKQELLALGYEFHEKSAALEPVIPFEQLLTADQAQVQEEEEEQQQ